jgi:hypothetical protein
MVVVVANFRTPPANRIAIRLLPRLPFAAHRYPVITVWPTKIEEDRVVIVKGLYGPGAALNLYP